MIKGTFKDHLVAWVHQYIESEHGHADAERIMDDIDRKYVHPCTTSIFSSMLTLTFSLLGFLRSPRSREFDDLQKAETMRGGPAMILRHL